jgi:hypothetical protein
MLTAIVIRSLRARLDPTDLTIYIIVLESNLLTG